MALGCSHNNTYHFRFSYSYIRCLSISTANTFDAMLIHPFDSGSDYLTARVRRRFTTQSNFKYAKYLLIWSWTLNLPICYSNHIVFFVIIIVCHPFYYHRLCCHCCFCHRSKTLERAFSDETCFKPGAVE